MIAIMAAMKEELAKLRESMNGSHETSYAGISFYEGCLDHTAVVACKSGIGKVNASMCAQILIDKFAPEAIIFTGVAGALDPDLDIGDAVISLDCQQHDVDVSALGFPKGTIPLHSSSVFAADGHLVELAILACGDVLARGARMGRVLSGDQFVADPELARSLHLGMGGACIEMEGAAVAQVCHANGVPFVVIRTVSDRADGSAHENFPAFVQAASDHSAQIVRTMLKRRLGGQIGEHHRADIDHIGG